ncbi:LysM peptidoglycan-binding domain-containing protein [Priestia megaterium]|uniref:LysM peptidoglycan-binding domain-containing protein n=1 Tax=Priestia megaterium TaxID=1404 RepID=A0A6H1NWJ7_PRIMG|nr:peptidoglycan endopeptidase [Priestia megaterium]QIZ05659.1 LysM peptidoglycan-binding domain-containing protein [Priestia megaterium]
MKKTIVRALSTAALLSTVFAGTALADTYKVQKGDSLSKIAQKYHTSVKVIKSANGLKSDFISVNQMLKITVASKTTQASQPATYTVVKGDALIKIANRFHVTVGELKLWNKLDTTIIRVGQRLTVAAPKQATIAAKPTTATKPKTTTAATSVYTVKSGDYLGKIAVNHKTTVSNLKSLNKLKSDMIYVGQKIKVPAQKAPVAPVKPATPKPPVTTTPPKTPATPPPVVQTEVTGYIVKSGDTLGGIAGHYQLTVKELKALNKLSSDRIFVGQKLKVPATATATVTGPKTEPTVDSDFAAKMIVSAKKLIGVPYVWGGSTPSGVDCSGFVYYAAKQAGMDIGRYSAAGFYDRTYYVNTPKAGDIVFFENTYKKGISHLGIYLGNNQFIHANDSGVMISNLQSPYYQAHFESFKRFY